eukprot:scaffold12195_cov126-Cylindrotheca_fusiformis.AAC.3
MVASFPRRIVLLILMGQIAVNGIPLLGGRFETTTDVQEYLNIALDVVDMRESDDLQTKQSIYKYGVQRDNEHK